MLVVMISPSFLILGQIQQDDPELYQDICLELKKIIEEKKLEKGESNDRIRHSEAGKGINE